MGQIEFHHVTRRFDNGQEGLKELSVGFESGSMTFLTGHSGAGKSTLARHLADESLAAAEYVSLDEEPALSLALADPAGKDGNDYPQMSAEYIVKANPDLIFLADT